MLLLFSSEIMKTIVFIACIVTLVVNVTAEISRQEMIDTLKKAHVECQADPATKADEDLMQKFFKDEPVDESSLAKHALCINVKVGVQKPNGDIDKKGFKKWMGGSENEQQIIEECGNKKGSTAEESTLALYKCFRKHRNEQGSSSSSS